jgi:NADPH-dependent curcumin reductase CurA
MTTTEKEKMLAGELYLSTDPQLQSALAEAQTYLRPVEYNPE